jgi:peptide/nickel transport system permease protein
MRCSIRGPERGHERWRMSTFVSRARRHVGFQIGAVLLVLFVGTALLSIVWTPYAVDELQMRFKLLPSSPAHWLGTDHLGRDVLSRIMVGAQTSITVGLIAVVLGMSAGVALGAWAAARGGWVDEALSRTSDLIFAFPAVLIAILITSVLGASAQNAILAIAIFNVPVFARVTRGAALAMWGRDFVRAAIAMGRGPLGITWRHVLPNILSVLIVQATIQFAVAILAEAGLSYLGLGAQPPVPSWGRMLRDAQTYIFQAPELAVWPGLAIALAVLGLNMLGDGLRDLLDPRLRLMRVG